MITINHNELAKKIHRHYETNESLYITGGIGIGKSETVRNVSQELAKKYKREFVEWNKISDAKKRELTLTENVEKVFIFADIRASQLEPSDLRGIPDINGHNPNNHRDFLEWKPQLLFRVLSNPNARGIIFFDEINHAPPSVQNALFQIILDKEIGELPISEGVLRIGAGNRTEDKAIVFEMPTPLFDRFSVVELKIPSVDEWIDWAIKHNIDSRIITFLKFQSDFLYKFDTSMKDKSPTPRSWAKASKLINGNNDYNEILIDVSSCVGEGTAMQFVAFCKLKEKIDIDNLISDIEKIKQFWDNATNKRQLDLKYAVISAISEKYRHNKKLFDVVINFCNIIEVEFARLTLMLIKEMDIKEWNKQILVNKIWKDSLSKKLSPYLME